MKILIKYLKGTHHLGLMIKTDKNGLKLRGYVNMTLLETQIVENVLQHMYLYKWNTLITTS